MAIDTQPMNVYWSGKRTGLIRNYRIKNKDSVDTLDDLPSSDNTIGDMYTVTETGKNYVWNGLTWDEVDFDIYDYNNIINMPEFALDVNTMHNTGHEVISGTKTFNDKIYCNLYVGTAGSTSFELRSQASVSNGASIILYSKYDQTRPGVFRCVPRTPDNLTVLEAHPDGTFIWRGQAIQTASDQRCKTTLETVPDEVLDAWGDVHWGQFKFLDSVATKGENARYHIGLIAQKIKEVFESHGLDACRYGILCHEEQPATDNLEAVDLWMIRYTEAQAMEAAYQRRRADRLEARIAAIEEMLK